MTHGRIAFITTPEFRKLSPDAVKSFVYTDLYFLCQTFEVLTTGRTHDFINECLEEAEKPDNLPLIATSMGVRDANDHDLQRWRDTITRGLKCQRPSVQGMIEITFELVEQRLDAVIHLTDWGDMSAKPDTAVLWREANVHDVPLACDIATAEAYVRAWRAQLPLSASRPMFRKRPRPEVLLPLDELRAKSVLAMIAHDNKKLEICAFAVRHADKLFNDFDYILTTGRTGFWLTHFMRDAKRSHLDVAKIRCCLSGQDGGDVQIANALVQGHCKTVFFFQDPSVSHPHDADIRLFQQAALALGVQLATNDGSAGLLLDR